MDARLTDDQEVAGSIPSGSDNILSWRLIMKIFSTVSLRAGKLRLGKLTSLDMTIIG